jgi:hypothetical protein
VRVVSCVTAQGAPVAVEIAEDQAQPFAPGDGARLTIWRVVLESSV